VLDGMPQVLAKPGRKVPLLIEVGNYPERNPIMGADMVFERLERYGYRACDAVTLRSMTRKTMPASQTTHVIFT